MPAKKMRVEVFDGGGNRYTVTFDGQVTREKALRLLDIVELLGGMPGVNPQESVPTSELPKLEKMRLVVEKHFPIVWFAAKDVQNVYEQEMKEPVALSMVSTYLTRLAGRGFLMKAGVSNGKRYRLGAPRTESQLNLAKDNK
ncbi:MAG TPA: hypothetical protein VJ249_01905 [Candidatus Bathyarchaeia archaeon]|nr:hypothetical protein [Candidatus Bathyarchaeia archaeon]